MARRHDMERAVERLLRLVRLLPADRLDAARSAGMLPALTCAGEWGVESASPEKQSAHAVERVSAGPRKSPHTETAGDANVPFPARGCKD